MSYVLDKSRDLARFFPPSSRGMSSPSLLSLSYAFYARLYGKGDAGYGGSGDAAAAAAAALLGMHRSRHDGREKGGGGGQDRARDSQPALLTSER